MRSFVLFNLLPVLWKQGYQAYGVRISKLFHQFLVKRQAFYTIMTLG